MRQAVPRIAAPLEPEPRWPAGHEQALREAGAKEVAMPCCAGQVRRFFARRFGRPRRDPGRTAIERFLPEPAARPGIGNGQVQQARDAGEFSYEGRHRIPLGPRLASAARSVSPASPPVQPRSAPPERPKPLKGYGSGPAPVNGGSQEARSVPCPAAGGRRQTGPGAEVILALAKQLDRLNERGAGLAAEPDEVRLRVARISGGVGL